jgi:hypothetical protein
VSANRRDEAHRFPRKSSIYRIDIESREITAITSGNDPERNPLPSPDGRHLAWLGFEDKKLSQQNNRLFVADIDGSNVRNLTEDLDRDIDRIAWDGNDAILIQYDHHGTTRLTRQSLGGKREVLSDQLGGEYYSRPYSSGQFAGGQRSDRAYPCQHLATLGTGRDRRWPDARAHRHQRRLPRQAHHR